MVMVAWQAEGNAGKKTIILDFKSEEGRKICHDLIKLSDIVLNIKGRLVALLECITTYCFQSAVMGDGQFQSGCQLCTVSH